MTTRARPQLVLLPLYAASAVLTLGEGSVALLLPPYLHRHGIHAATIGAIVSVYGVASLASRIPAGSLYRSHRAAAIIAGGCAMSSIAFFAIPLTGHPVVLGALVGLDGLGFGVATTAAMAALMDVRPPEADAGAVMGWYTGSVGVGYAVAGFVGGVAGDLLGVSHAILLLAVVPLFAAAALAAALRRTQGARSDAVPQMARSFALRAFLRAPALVWLAFFVTLYINLVSGVLNTFFPIYGLAIGLSLAQIGFLSGIHGAFAAAVRFAAGPLFRIVPYRRTVPLMVVVSGASIALLAGSKLMIVLAVAWGAIGISRGLLRVASGAVVLDAAPVQDADRGAASAIYLSGLDVGKIVGPLVGGASVSVVGMRWTFLLVATVFPALYFALAAGLGAIRARTHSRPILD